MLLILQLSPARRRAIAAAGAETLAVLAPYAPALRAGGPCGEVGGVFWVELGAPGPGLEERLPLLAYTDAVFALAPLPARPAAERPARSAEGALPPHVRWRGAWYAVRRLWQRDAEEERETSPDRRSFLLPGPDGSVREVRGYRGDRRALPPADARLTVNLALTPGCRRCLDPFAGAGGIVAAARRHGPQVLSADIDPFVRHGLAALSTLHLLTDAGHLPLRAGSVDAVATEPPYAPELIPAVADALAECARVVRPGGRLSFFAAEVQTAALIEAGDRLPLTLLHRFRIDRKGTACEALVWEKRSDE